MDVQVKEVRKPEIFETPQKPHLKGLPAFRELIFRAPIAKHPTGALWGLSSEVKQPSSCAHGEMILLCTGVVTHPNLQACLVVFYLRISTVRAATPL